MEPGARLGPYEVVARIGAGGMGEVWRARDTRLERDVALKVLPAEAVADEVARARLLREARLASKLNHPHICTIHEVGEADGQVYIAMELVEGQTLAERLSEHSLSAEEVLRFGQQLADALSHAHEHGVVHRDFKSANVIITPEGRAKVLDFGLAKRLVGAEASEATTLSRATLTEAGAIAGTPAYMAPEQLRGLAADTRSDIWALGVVL
jgi:serine/threonine protein kinase